jgi:uncharacterized protein YbbK (DUF523 family)/uncharacterized protein YbgA (DUF1722 family)
MRDAERPRVGISACLLGRTVRFDGGHKRDAYLADTLGRWVEWVPVCPEVELGLGTPRETLRLEGCAAAPRLVAPQSGADHTESMLRLARSRVADLARQGLVGFVLKEGSPSCGMERVRVYGEKPMPERSGTGVFARVLMEHLPLMPVEEEGRLHDPALRESFIERLFGYARWRRFLAGHPTRTRLVAFHAAHELALLAHDRAAYRRLRRLVRAKARSLAAVLADYGQVFMRALSVRATAASHADVLEDVLGCFSAGERREMVELIGKYRRGLVPLVVPLTRVRHHARRLGIESLQGQVYLDPDPRELTLRHEQPLLEEDGR